LSVGVCSRRQRINRVFTLVFPDAEVATGSSGTRHIAVRKQWFEPSVGTVATLEEAG
jgi:hypothetical protein